MRRFALQLTFGCCLWHAASCAGGPDDDGSDLRPRIGGPISDYPVMIPTGLDGGAGPILGGPGVGVAGTAGGVGGGMVVGGGIGDTAGGTAQPALDAGVAPVPEDPETTPADAVSFADPDAGCAADASEDAATSPVVPDA